MQPHGFGNYAARPKGALTPEDALAMQGRPGAEALEGEGMDEMDDMGGEDELEAVVLELLRRRQGADPMTGDTGGGY